MKPRRQLSNAAATWLSAHKDALLPRLDELDDLPASDYADDDDYKVGVPSYGEE